MEWNIGESAGLLAHYCLQEKTTPTEVRGRQETLKDFQSLLRSDGLELEWPELGPL